MHSYRNPVLFTAAAGEIPNGAVVVEIGPHSILRSPLRQSRPDLSYVGAMRKGDCGLQTVAAAVADLWRRGAPVRWRADPVPKDLQGSERTPLSLSSSQVLVIKRKVLRDQKLLCLQVLCED